MRMDGPAQAAVRYKRETQFLQNMRAFMRGNFALVEAAWRPDVVITLPGSSWLAGTHRGYEDVSRCVRGLRQVLASEQTRTQFLHEDDQMIVRHDIKVNGPTNVVEMSLRVRVRYDRDGKAAGIYLEPDDLALFDHVLNTPIPDQSTA
jgi:ketosteroid isomerase-like protein